MAELSCEPLSCEINDIKKLLWGSFVKDDVFRRWAQGFCFSKDEPTALVQTDGGPCAVIAPVQAFILKSIIAEPAGNNWREVYILFILNMLVISYCIEDS